MGKLRMAIIGVGNCASSLVQGVEYYRNTEESDLVPGLMHVNLGGYHIGDIESAYFMKSPPVQHSDKLARQMTEEFIAANAPSPSLSVVPPTIAIEAARVARARAAQARLEAEAVGEVGE